MLHSGFLEKVGNKTGNKDNGKSEERPIAENSCRMYHPFAFSIKSAIQRQIGKECHNNQKNQNNQCVFHHTLLPSFWSEIQDLNLRPPAPKAGALPAALIPDVLYILFCFRCFANAFAEKKIVINSCTELRLDILFRETMECHQVTNSFYLAAK